MRNCKPRNQCHVLTAVTSAPQNESLWLVSYMPLAVDLRQLALPHARRRGGANLSHVAFLTVATERWLTWGEAGVKGERI